jgi:hypothetical protein
MCPAGKFFMGLEGVLTRVHFTGREITWNSSCFWWDHFDGNMPANNMLYNILRAPADERRAMIQVGRDPQPLTWNVPCFAKISVTFVKGSKLETLLVLLSKNIKRQEIMSYKSDACDGELVLLMWEGSCNVQMIILQDYSIIRIFCSGICKQDCAPEKKMCKTIVQKSLCCKSNDFFFSPNKW